MWSVVRLLLRHSETWFNEIFTDSIRLHCTTEDAVVTATCCDFWSQNLATLIGEFALYTLNTFVADALVKKLAVHDQIAPYLFIDIAGG